MKNWLITLIIVSNSFICHADEDSVAITKGTPAPFDGVLLSNSKANKVKSDLELQSQINTSLQKSVDLYKTKDVFSNNQINLLLNQNKRLADSLNKEVSNDKLQNIVWFSLGVIATGLALNAAKKAITN